MGLALFGAPKKTLAMRPRRCVSASMQASLSSLPGGDDVASAVEKLAAKLGKNIEMDDPQRLLPVLDGLEKQVSGIHLKIQDNWFQPG